MAYDGPIVYVDDDEDDLYLFSHIIDDLAVTNPIRHFNQCNDALNYLKVTEEKPLIILCDVNLPIMSGFEMRDLIEGNPYLKKKSIPFVFFSTAGNRHYVDKAFESTIQGFFLKSNSFQIQKNILESIIQYWKNALTPN